MEVLQNMFSRSKEADEAMFAGLESLIEDWSESRDGEIAGMIKSNLDNLSPTQIAQLMNDLKSKPGRENSESLTVLNNAPNARPYWK